MQACRKFWLNNSLGYIVANKVQIPTIICTKFLSPISKFYAKGAWLFDQAFELQYPDIFKVLFILGTKDELLWTYSPSGYISSKEAYEFVRHKDNFIWWTKFIWPPYISPTSSTLFWNLMTGKVPCEDILMR